MSTAHSAARSRRKLLITAALFSTGGVAIKSIHMTGIQVAGLRSGFAALVLFAAIPAARRNWNPMVLLFAVAYALTLMSFVVANKLTTSANAIFLQDTSTLYILIFGALILHERPSRADLLATIPIAIGLVLCFLGGERAVETAPRPMLGNWIAAISGVFYSMVVIGFRWLARGTRENTALPVAAFGNLFAFLLCLPFAWPFQSRRAEDWGILVFLGTFQIGLAYLLMSQAINDVPAFESSLLLMLEPVLNPIWTWLVWHERPSNFAILGGILIIGATVARAWAIPRGDAGPEPAGV